jgi:hypothetical protein
MAYSGGLNPNVVKTALDGIFEQEWYAKQHNGFVDATSPLVFMQDSIDRGAVIQEIFKGVGLWEERAEEQDVASDDPRVANQKTLSVLNFAKSMDITKNFFDDNQHGAYTKAVRDFARKGRIARDDNAFKQWRNSFTTATTADGAAIVSDTHTTIGGATVDNKLTAALSETSLNDAIISLMNQKDQSGVVSGVTPHCLLVPIELFKTACEIVDSEWRSGTSDNELNVFSSKYGIYIATTNRLGATISGGSNSAWWLLSQDHGMYRYVRQGMETALIDWRFSRNNNYVYKGEFRETVGAWDYAGIVGSDGTT